MGNCLRVGEKKENKLDIKKPIYFITLSDYEKLEPRQQLLLHSKYDVREQTGQ